MENRVSYVVPGSSGTRIPTEPVISLQELHELRWRCLELAADSVADADVIEQASRYETYILEGYEALMKREYTDGIQAPLGAEYRGSTDG